MKLTIKITGILAVLVMIMALAPAGVAADTPTIAVSDAQVSPAALMPGDSGTVTVTLANPSASLSGSSTTQTDTYNYLSGTSQGMVTPSPTSTPTPPSSNSPDGSVNIKEVTLLADAPVRITSNPQYLDFGLLGMGSKATFTFNIKVDDTAANGRYPMTLKVRTGSDGVYVNYPLSLLVDDSQLNVILNDAPQSFSRVKQSVVIDIMNARPNQVDGVSVVPAGSDFIFKPIQQYAVGSIGAGELYTVQFDVTARNASSSYSGSPSFVVYYKNGVNQHQTAPLTVPTDPGTAPAAASSSGSSDLLLVGGVLAALIIILCGIFLYMRNKGTKR
jgi:hypothetical protein